MDETSYVPIKVCWMSLVSKKMDQLQKTHGKLTGLSPEQQFRLLNLAEVWPKNTQTR